MKVQEFRKVRSLKAEITVFLSLIMVVILAFIGAMIESSSIQLAKYYKRGDMDIGMNSVFAEYQKELLEEYGIFTLDATYNKGMYESNRVLNRLEFYGVTDSELDISRVQFLSDYNGAAFYQQVSYYVKNKYGLDSLDTHKKEIKVGEEQVERGIDFEEKKEQVEGGLPQVSEQTEGEQIPTTWNKNSSELLELVLPSQMEVSDHQIVLDQVASHRSLETGSGTFVLEEDSDMVKGMILSIYGMDKFQNATDESSAEHPLQYELEYLLKGKSTDAANLKGVVSDMFFMRAATNYLCLLQSPTKHAEAEAMGLVLATLATQPELEPAFTQALLVAWSCGESVMDLRNLLSGGRVALVKTEQDWQLGLAGLLTLGTNRDAEVTKDLKDGLSYKDYLRMLLCIENKDTLTMRMLDVIEMNMNAVCHQEYFRVDSCINKLEIDCVSTVQGGYTYQFPTYYEYQ